MNNKTRLLIGSLLLVLCIGNIGVASAFDVPDEIITFLGADNTNEHTYIPYLYSCGHFSRDLARNATDYDLSIGSAILSNNPVFKGFSNHIVNYYNDNGTLYFIEPQTDNIMTLSQIFFEYSYIRLYPDGTQVPSYWIRHLAPTIRAPED